MKKKFFLAIYLPTIVFVVVILFIYAYFEMQNKPAATTPPATVRAPEAGSAVPAKAAEAQVSITGYLTDAPNGGKPVLTSMEGDNYELILGAKAEIFRNGERATISDIQKKDLVSVLGSKKGQESRAISVDSVYANTDDENASVMLPL
ncbi:MAG: hypothetical protein MUD10_01355 [Candidatus Pacebacteria bacterium]|jgi:hypothetical protein|nr:hypothetical protein [Candidatus Paceibacterota bacterium]